MFVIYCDNGLYSNGYYTDKELAETEVSKLNEYFEDKDRWFWVLELVKA